MSILYSDLKMFHFPEKLDSLTLDQKITAPIHIRLKPTNHCNHRCSYCAYLNTDLQLGQDMQVKDSISRVKMLEITHDIVEMGVKAVTFSGGGEPLTYPHLLEASQILVAGGVNIACLTNGSLLQKNIADFFAHNATWVRVSMDGYDDQSYTHYRGVKLGEYTKIMQNLENFSKLNGKCVLGISLIIDQHNCSQVYTTIKNLKNVGVNNIKISGCITSNDATQVNIYHQPHFNSTKDQIQKAIDDFKDDKYEINDSFHNLEERFAKNYTWCPSIQMKTIIAADLGVYSCQDKAYNLQCGLLGNLKEQTFFEFWFNNKELFYKINPSQDCKHHCISNLKNKMLFDYMNISLDHLDFV